FIDTVFDSYARHSSLHLYTKKDVGRYQAFLEKSKIFITKNSPDKFFIKAKAIMAAIILKMQGYFE
ncbi:hypothetical protein, partial [Zymomonas mobilis]|uniref:hypothetical protein n=1 Tax=Zymomonas mobilis TaxID=542 RepID=UPI0039EA690D